MSQFRFSLKKCNQFEAVECIVQILTFKSEGLSALKAEKSNWVTLMFFFEDLQECREVQEHRGRPTNKDRFMLQHKQLKRHKRSG